jgi:polyhydroxyalkanoate synthesis regulator phasin
MKTTNPVLDTIIESQTQIINNWMDSAKKMQSALAKGNIASDGQQLYKEYFDKQMDILNSMKNSAGSMFGQSENNPQDFFRNWFNQQATYAKQMADFNQSIQSSFNNFGRPAQEYTNAFGQANSAFTGIYDAWINALNASYDSLSRQMNGTFNKDVFGNFVQGSQVYTRMQEFFQPMAEAMQKGKFNVDAFREYFTPESYKNLARQMFGNFYNDASIREVYDNAIRQIQDFFTTQNNLSKEYFTQVKNITDTMPQLFAGGAAGQMKEFYGQIQNVFGKTFEPLLKLANPGKEKENIEALIVLMDRVAEYTVKQAELQALLQNTARKAVEDVGTSFAEKFADPKNLAKAPDAQELYSEWVKVNEKLFTDLFASEEFSKVKGETLNLSMDVKKHFESQFESSFKHFPVVFKSEVEELHKIIHDLKKQVRELKSEISGVVADEDKSAKTRKK